MFAGVTVVPWYPITPSSSVVENLIDLMKKHRVVWGMVRRASPIVQAEDELAAIGMVLGAGWAGARGDDGVVPDRGISLMAEFAGLGYYAEIPGVISMCSERAVDRFADAHVAGGPDVLAGIRMAIRSM